jgi:two-component system, NtrC family, response regulator HydG
MKKILVIDDDTYICNLLVNYLNQNGFEAEGTFTGLNGIKNIEKQKYDVVLCDYRLPDSDGFEILKHIKTKKPELPVIIMTAYADIKVAVKLIKYGAFDYVTKPIQPEEIIQLVNRSLDGKKEQGDGFTFQTNFVTGSSDNMREVMEHVKIVAPTDLSVLIEGETGSGKEYIARAIHHGSSRADKPFVAVDCGAIPKELANSELFGHIKGAFTGAVNDKKGCFEQAKGGTLFLDEVGNLPYENQVKLLRALQEKKISRVGDSKTMNVDVRIITATNEDLLKHVEANEFREDLYHRLNGFKIHIPPLRDRGEDIMEFAGYFIKMANKAFNKNIIGIDEKCRELFYKYNWYGNIRELQNVINRAVLLSQGENITPEVLPYEIQNGDQHGGKISTGFNNNMVIELKQATLVTEKEVISNALTKTNFNKSKAAQMLNIDRKTLYNKIKQYDIEVLKP